MANDPATAHKPGSPWRLVLLFIGIAVAVSAALAWSMGLIGQKPGAEDRLSDTNVAVAEQPYPLDLPDLANDVAPGDAIAANATAPDVAPPRASPPPVAAAPQPSAKPKSILPQRSEPIRVPRPADTIRAAATRAAPLAPLDRLFGRGDYPAAARSARQEGTTTVTLGVDAAGRAITCRIVATSGSVALDAATCRVLVSRARFSPAIGADGQRTSDRYVQRIRWALK